MLVPQYVEKKPSAVTDDSCTYNNITLHVLAQAGTSLLYVSHNFTTEISDNTPSTAERYVGNPGLRSMIILNPLDYSQLILNIVYQGLLLNDKTYRKCCFKF